MTGKQLLAAVAAIVLVGAWLDSRPSRQTPARASAQPGSPAPESFRPAQLTPTEALEFTPPVRRRPAPSFHGYNCTDDCSGHEAGYEWAKERGITDPDECEGNSQSFIEGCLAAAEEDAPEDGDEDVID